MTTDAHPVAVVYSNDELRLLVEEFLSMQKTEFSLKEVCSYVLYWAIEEGRAGGVRNTFYERNQLQESDCERIRKVLESILKDGRISIVPVDSNRFVKQL